MRLTYYGHSCFLVETRDGTRVVLDPYVADCYDGALRYGPIVEPADVAIASHTHADHCGVDIVPGDPLKFIQPQAETVGGLTITGVDTRHDDSGGSERGSNTIVVLDDGDIRLAHLGDLGHVLDAQTAERLGRVDVLLIPVGGHFTIDHAAAAKVVDALQPRIVVPMHYKTEKIDFPIAGVDPFLATQAQVERKESSTLEATAATLPAERSVVVLNPLL
jgi:L-ascorbate metabolism protein UlaG (beta-lactamase superfamily)